MNEPSDSPADLAKLEAALLATRADVPEGLATRAMAAARKGRADGDRTAFWHYAAGLAAAVLIGLNLALSAGASGTPAPAGKTPSPEAYEQAYRQIRQAAPDLPPRQVAAHAFAMTAGQLQPYGIPRGSWPR
ncbi:MAG: hypothetical protein NT031_14060 [Planctomycetota bacterium]|nr:hypothetical protein [Planctomycetota bacterium]